MSAVQSRLSLILLLSYWSVSSVAQAQSDRSEPLAQGEVCERTADMPAALKMDHYRSATPDCVLGGKTIHTEQLQNLLQQDEPPILIDVWAILRRAEEGFGSEWLPNKKHYSLPNTVWLPNVGYGLIPPDMEIYLSEQLHELTAANKQHPLVFFCVADCWMSWNAVQRAAELGYTNVYWYKNGIDGWQEAGLPLEEVHPVPVM